MSIFFSADWHLGHKNIIKHQGRPFADTHEMHQAIVERHNAVVGPEDDFYFVGDLTLGNPNSARAIVQRMNGRKHWVLGNHDKKPVVRKLADLFQTIDTRLVFAVPDPDASRGRQVIVLDHFAGRTWDCKFHGSWQLYGHSHGMLPDIPTDLAFDVGVDCWNFTPISYEQVKARMAEKTWTPPKSRR